MKPEQEEEWLTQIAAGTDPLTAFAALPDEGDDQEHSGTTNAGATCGGCGALVVVLLVIVWLVFRRC